MKITIIYDNTVCNPNLTPDWGFACLVEVHGRAILFDTGAKGDLLLGNMDKLGILPGSIHTVFLSHPHWDHTGGLESFLTAQPAMVIAPIGCAVPANATDVVSIRGGRQFGDDFYSTGALDNFEQALVVRNRDHLVVVAGCSHPGVGRILQAASGFGKVNALVGGLHGFEDFALIETLDRVCPTHCTQHIGEIQRRFPDKYIQGGAGRVMTL